MSITEKHRVVFFDIGYIECSCEEKFDKLDKWIWHGTKGKAHSGIRRKYRE